MDLFTNIHNIQHYVTSLLLCILCICYSSSYNIDVTVPIIKTSTADSYFGFSVAQHQIDQDEYGHLVLVGAPRAEANYPGMASHLQEARQPGVVFRCDLTSQQTDCQPLDLLTQKEPDGNYSDQWFGVSVASQGTPNGAAVACAHRYKWHSEDFSWGIGLCAFLTNDLYEDMLRKPCNFTKTDNPKKDVNGWCLAGMDVTLSSENYDVLYGLPGATDRRGSIIKSTSPAIFNEILDHKTTNYESITKGDDAVTLKDSYLGFSVAIAERLTPGGVQRRYIAGSPRSRATGEVFIFKEATEPYRLLTDKLEWKLSPGSLDEALGSGFGYDIIVVDLNGDDLDDIVVGAPFYHIPGVKSSGGAIFVYINSKKGITSDTEPVRIAGRYLPQGGCSSRFRCQNGQFGLSLANIGDINGDGFNDIAVGAPYEGLGAVYIYHGAGSPSGIRPEFSQRITPQHLNLPISLEGTGTFGHALSGGKDIDKNGRPDLVVGAYGSDAIAILRARPVVNVEVRVSNNPDVVDPDEPRICGDKSRNICFLIEICFTLDEEQSSISLRNVELGYNLEAEVFTGKQVSRVLFKNGIEKSSSIENSIPLGNGQSLCREHWAYIVSGNKDFFNPLDFKLDYLLREKTYPVITTQNPMPELNPVLDPATSQKIFSVDFKKDCGADNICHSNMKLTAELLHLDSQGPHSYTYKMGESSELALLVSVDNLGVGVEDAHVALLTVGPVGLSSYLTYINIEPTDGGEYSCFPGEDNVTCSLGNPLKKGKSVEFVMRLNPSAIQPTTTEFGIDLMVTTLSEELDKSDNVLNLTVKVITETDIVVRAQVAEEVIYGFGKSLDDLDKTESAIGSLVLHTYEIKNEGKAKLSNTIVTVTWPEKIHPSQSQIKYLLYLLEEPLIEAPGRCVLTKEMINPEQFVINAELLQEVVESGTIEARTRTRTRTRTRARTRREVSSADYSAKATTQVNVAHLSCGQDSEAVLECFEFSCETGPLMPGQSITIFSRARIWNSTLVEHYRDVDRVHIITSVKVATEKGLNNRDTNPSNNNANAVTKAFPDISLKEGPGVPLWALILASIGGLLLLIILVIVLWKCGFFKRAKKDEMEAIKKKDEIQKKRISQMSQRIGMDKEHLPDAQQHKPQDMQNTKL